MERISSHAIADILFELNWSSDSAAHCERYFGRGVKFWRDILPVRLGESLFGKGVGERAAVPLAAHEAFGAEQERCLHRLRRSQFEPKRVGAAHLEPLVGRFYPKGLLHDVAGIFSLNSEPFRVISVDEQGLEVDLAHPLAGRPVTLIASIENVTAKSMPKERGGSIHDWLETIGQGPGMQARWRNKPTDFWQGDPLARLDESADPVFYRQPRLVPHLDETALHAVRQLYSEIVKPGDRVIDLLSSWQSHLPDDRPLAHVVGVGLNETELRHNRALQDYLVQDLNAEARLDLPDEQFDVAVCSLSVEYLINPDAVFAEVARLLRPEGIFLVTFSNRWFEPKAIQLWHCLHEFERMGLVLEYFHRAGRFSDLRTFSLRGLPRPAGDRYFGRIPVSDPLYAVWGRRRR